MPPPIRAFVSTSPMSTFTKGPYRAGNQLRTPQGILVARDLDSALWEHRCWPIQLHEVEVDPKDVLETVEVFWKVRAFQVVRDVPLSDALGPRVGEIEAMFHELRRIPWLAPRAVPDEVCVAALVQEHYAAMGSFMRVEALPPRIVTDWEEAVAADNAVLKRSRPNQATLGVDATKDALWNSPVADDRRHALNKMNVAPFHLAYQYVWEAGWRVAASGFLARAARTHMADVQVRSRTLERIRKNLAAAKDKCRRKAWAAISEVRSGEVQEEGYSTMPTMNSLARESDRELTVVWVSAWNFANAALSVVASAAAHCVALSDSPNPWLPTFSLFRLGAWPIDEVDGHLVIYFPPPSN